MEHAAAADAAQVPLQLMLRAKNNAPKLEGGETYRMECWMMKRMR